MPLTSSLTPPILFSVKYILSVPRKPNSCTNGWKNNLPKDILNHPSPHMLQAPSVLKIRMGPIAWYKTTDLSTTGRSETNTRFPTSNILPKNFRGICYSPNLISGLDTTTSTFAQGTNGKPLSARQKDIGNPRSCISDSVMHPPPFNESSTSSYNPSRINTQG